MLGLEERAALADRAYVRHRFTTYHDELDAAMAEVADLDDDEYRMIKRAAQDEFDDYLARHPRAMTRVTKIDGLTVDVYLDEQLAVIQIDGDQATGN